MEACLREFNTFHGDSVDQPMLLRDSPRPATGELVTERFWFTRPAEWVPQHGLDEVQYFDGGIPIRFHPEA